MEQFKVLREVCSRSIKVDSLKLGGGGSQVFFNDAIHRINTPVGTFEVLSYQNFVYMQYCNEEPSKWVIGLYDACAKISVLQLADSRSMDSLLDFVDKHTYSGTAISWERCNELRPPWVGGAPQAGPT
eukprot:m.194292 g.194292  ORF g.194292 m.194292 type:complete len:128 (+) comp39494_c1_seq3:758-1141(+)